MSHDHALRLSSILLACASFLGLAFGAPLPQPLVWLTGSALALVLLRTLRHRIDPATAPLPLSPAAWNIVLLTAFAGFWADMLWLSGELLPAGIHFLLILLVIKLWTLKTRRDYLQLHAISLVAILASAALTTDLWYLAVLIMYLLCGVWTLLLLHLTKPPAHPRDPLVPANASQLVGEGRIGRDLFWLVNGLTALAACFTIVIFFAIPRVNAGFFQKGYGASIRTSGFSDTVDLGAIGPIKRDPSIVMRVELPDRAARDLGRLYLRGVAYDRYDGVSWSNQLPHRRSLPESAPMTFSVRQPPRTANAGPAIRQNILLESLDTAVLFAAPFADSVTGRFPSVQADVVGALSLPFPSSSRIEYTAVSRPPIVLPEDYLPQTVAYSEAFGRHFLESPALSERITALARAITQDKASRFDQAQAIERHLISNYRYSLDVPLTKQRNPIEEFLFSRKTGYCEHYATAMVLMLRSIGIPARLVTGFLATEWNDYGNYYVVRQQDAHAWVELHLPRSGWIMMDPTPPATDNVPPAGWHTLGRIMDTFRLRWNRLFVQYSAADQLAVVRELRAGGASVRNRARDSLSSVVEALAAKGHALIQGVRHEQSLLAAGAILLIGLAAWTYRRARWGGAYRSVLSTAEMRPVTGLYDSMLRHLARNGIVKTPATGPLEFLELVASRWAGALGLVTMITDLYCRGRFGGHRLTEEELVLARQSLDQLLHLHRAD
jgi:hypothetical protein